MGHYAKVAIVLSDDLAKYFVEGLEDEFYKRALRFGSKISETTPNTTVDSLSAESAGCVVEPEVAPQAKCKVMGVDALVRSTIDASEGLKSEAEPKLSRREANVAKLRGDATASVREGGG
jgi:hypothetical protein